MEDSIENIKLQDIEIHKLIGSSSFVKIYHVTLRKSYKGYTEAALKRYRDLNCEFKLSKTFNHPNIVKIIGLCNMGESILMEYALYGSVQRYLYDTTKPLPPTLKRKWIKESALGIRYLHEMNIVSRDVDARNCLLFEGYVLKLCDFVLACKTDGLEQMRYMAGYSRYMAPEIITKQIYSTRSDIYAYGILLVTIYTRKRPFDDMEMKQILWEVGHNGKTPAVPEDFPDDLLAIVHGCWNIDPKKRPSITQIISDLAYTELQLTNKAGSQQWSLKNQYAYCPQRSQTLDHEGGKIEVPDTDACLVVPPGAIPKGKDVDVSVSVHWGNNYPPLQTNDSVIGPVVSCKPDGYTFQKPVQITLPHSAKNISAKHITIWNKKSSRPEHRWKNLMQKYYDLDIDKKHTIVISVYHFSCFTPIMTYISNAIGLPALAPPTDSSATELVVQDITDPTPEQSSSLLSITPLDPDSTAPTLTIPLPTIPTHPVPRHDSEQAIPEYHAVALPVLPANDTECYASDVPALPPTDPEAMQLAIPECHPSDIPALEHIDPEATELSIPEYHALAVPVLPPTKTEDQNAAIPECYASDVPALEHIDPEAPDPEIPECHPSDATLLLPTDPEASELAIPEHRASNEFSLEHADSEPHTERVMLPFLFPPDLGRDQAFITIYVARKDEIECIKACEDSILCGLQRPLLFNMRKDPISFIVNCTNPKGCWEPEEGVSEEISLEKVRMGGRYSHCAVVFTKHNTNVVDSIMGFIKGLQKDERIMNKSRFNNDPELRRAQASGAMPSMSQQQASSSNHPVVPSTMSTAQDQGAAMPIMSQQQASSSNRPVVPSTMSTAQDRVVSGTDILDIVEMVNLDDLYDVYIHLGLDPHVIEQAKGNENTSRRKAINVLFCWSNRMGDAATRKEFIRAMNQCQNCKKAMGNLLKKWGITE